MNEKITTLNLGMVNAYLLKAKDGFVLIDSGMPYHWPALETQLTAAGCVPGKLKLVIFTHGDWDHTGSAIKLREKYNVKLAIGAGDVPQVERGVMLRRKVKPFIYWLKFKYRMFMRRFDKNWIAMPRFKPDILLSDGQSLAEYGLAARVIHTPGHTPGSLSVLTDDGDLFAGDLFTNRKKPAEANIIENSAQLNSSLEKLKTRNIRTIYPGHGRPFEREELYKGKRG
jgi:hydroxyacylglutathione hydrolase